MGLLVFEILFFVASGVALAGEVTGDGSTALHWASYRDDAAVVRSLIRNKADVNAATDLGVTPLWAASQNGSIEIVRLLLEAGADPNLAQISGETPLMAAARAGKAEVVEQLLRKGAKPNLRATRGQTALMWAAAQKHPQAVRALLAGGADVSLRSEVWSQMMAVPPHGLRENNRMIPHGGFTALLFAVRSGDLESTKLLMAAGADVNDHDAWGVTATVLAAHSGYREIVEVLLDKGADPNKADAGFTALQAAIMHCDERMAAALLSKGADPNVPVKVWTPTRRSSHDYHFPPALIGATPYWLAARFAQPGLMRLLVKHGADPKVIHRAQYFTGNMRPRAEATTALMAAMGMGTGSPWTQSRRQMKDAVEAALASGVDLSVRNTDGRTALDAAKAQGMVDVVKLLSR